MVGCPKGWPCHPAARARVETRHPAKHPETTTLPKAAGVQRRHKALSTGCMATQQAGGQPRTIMVKTRHRMRAFSVRPLWCTARGGEPFDMAAAAADALVCSRRGQVEVVMSTDKTSRVRPKKPGRRQQTLARGRAAPPPPPAPPVRSLAGAGPAATDCSGAHELSGEPRGRCNPPGERRGASEVKRPVVGAALIL